LFQSKAKQISYFENSLAYHASELKLESSLLLDGSMMPWPDAIALISTEPKIATVPK
jgi:hypothetical protein